MGFGGETIRRVGRGEIRPVSEPGSQEDGAFLTGTSRWRYPILTRTVAEAGFEPRDLRIMSPMSYQTAPLRTSIL